ncbi:class I SAM-dependent methyltransferase [Dehalococcoidia bacterium]|nr:class I SAM-dependent methyltransferase [Dehalococcoidia bacterium]
MNWSDEWRKLVSGSSLRKSGDPFTSGEFVEWYELQLEHNNYPGVLLDKVQRHLNKHSTVLDIGAGTGAFALPLARLVKTVTVVEPSVEMLTHLRRKMDTTNIRIINKRWEDVDIKEIGRHDMVLAAHSLYGTVDIETALKKMLSAAKTQVCLVIGVGPVDFYADIWRRFRAEEYHPPPSFIHLYNVLYQLGIAANVEMVKVSRSQVYLNIEQAVKCWQTRLDLRPEREDELREYLLSCLEEKEGVLYRKEEGKSAIISVELPV